MPANNSRSKIQLFLQDHRNLLMNSLLVLVLVLGAFLRFYQPGASGIENVHYAAAVKSMLQSWHNFFFLAFEPGGSVSVDTTILP